ncbi:MAG: hypothetical protein LBR36_02420 [Bacteroidales bacterium]|jgi:hypothetical protein|nr:hypothetical protein [Bacteroidales bacterium]
MQVQNCNFFSKQWLLYFLIGTVGMLLMVGCKLKENSKNRQVVDNQGVVNYAPVAKTDALFLLFEIKKDISNGEYHILLIDTTLAHSISTQKFHWDEISPAEESLKIEVYQNQQLTQIQYMENPLSKYVETFENEIITKQKIELSQTEFYIRIPVKINQTELKIYQIHNNQIIKLLYNTKL